MLSPRQYNKSSVWAGAFLLYRKIRPIEQKDLRAGCARICEEDALRAKFGAAKHVSTRGKCNVAERACMLCSLLVTVQPCKNICAS